MPAEQPLVGGTGVLHAWLTQLEYCGQVAQADPFLPQAVLLVPAWQAPALTQPVQQAPFWQLPLVQGVPLGAAPSLQVPSQLACWQAFPATQAAQLAPPVPHAPVLVPGLH